MQKLLDFLFAKRDIGLFLVLEIVGIWLMVSYNNRYNASFFNSNNHIVASISQQSNRISDYFYLNEENKLLRKENLQLQQKLQRLQLHPFVIEDTVDQYRITNAKVISYTFSRGINFITIAAGQKNDIMPGMGVISSDGVVGQVKSVSKNFATVYSLLHPKLMVSSKVKRLNAKATVQWDQKTYDRASLKYIPRHIPIQKGDSIVTSGFNSVFPEDILIGYIDEVQLSEEMAFYDATLRLATDFTSLHQVYVIKDLLKQEKDSLQQL